MNTFDTDRCRRGPDLVDAAPAAHAGAARRRTPVSTLLGAAGIGAAAVLLAGLLATLVAGLLTPDAGRGLPGGLSLPELQAELGEGEYLFLPNRRSMWVVHPREGRIIHYRFLDTLEGAVEKSFVAAVDPKVYPPQDTSYRLSERNITDLLWVCNERTGDFQLWRRNVRDGRLITDPMPVAAGKDLGSEAAIRSSAPPTRP